MKKLIILACCFSGNVFAQNLDMDNLININENNYCYTLSKLRFQNIIDYFEMNEKSVPVVAGFKSAGLSVSYPTVEIKKSGLDISSSLTKDNPKKYPIQDIVGNPVSNSYIITNAIALRFNESAGILANRITSQFNGLVFTPDGLGGGYNFLFKSSIDLKDVKGIKEYNKEYEKNVEGIMSFTITPISTGEFKGGSVLYYRCNLNIAMSQDPNNLAKIFKGKWIK